MRLEDIKPGMILRIPRKEEEGLEVYHGKVPYEVVDIYPHCIYCRNCKAGYGESFTPFQLFEMGILPFVYPDCLDNPRMERKYNFVT